MAIKTKLNSAWSANEAMDAVFAVRAAAENGYVVLEETITKINAITSGAKFGSVDAEIKTEGAEIISILNQAKDALDNHKDFLNWRKPR